MPVCIYISISENYNPSKILLIWKSSHFDTKFVSYWDKWKFVLPIISFIKMY